MGQKKTRLAVLSLAGAALVAVAIGWWRHERAAPETSAVDEGFHGMPLRAGDVHTYELELRSKLGAGGGTVVEYTLRGTWSMLVLRANAQGALIRASLEDAELSASGQAVADQASARLAQAKRDFASPITYRLNEEGVLLSVTDSADVELQVRSMMRAIAAGAQVVRPRGAATAWEVTERDGTGEYLVQYALAEHARLTKRKVRYTQLSPQALPALQGGGALVIDAAKATLQLRDDGFLLEVSSEETLRATGNTLGGVTTTTQLHLTFAGTGTVSAQQLASAVAEAPTQDSAPNEYAQEGSYSAEADRARIGGRSFADFMGDLNSLPRDEKQYTDADRNKQRRAFIGLAASFRQAPETVNEALAVIKRGSAWASFLWDALGSAGSPAAQAALRELIDMPSWNEEQRLAQMISLSMVEKPTLDSVDFLKGKLHDPEQHTQARYGLGTAAFNLRKTEPERATAIVSHLNQEIAKAPGDASRVEFLKALGNSGHPDALATVISQLQSTDLRLRMTALDALRFMEGEQVNDLIASAIENDPEGSVRFAATSAAAWRPASDSLLHALALAWKRDPSTDVQKNAHAAIMRLDGRYPGLMAQVESAYASL